MAHSFQTIVRIPNTGSGFPGQKRRFSRRIPRKNAWKVGLGAYPSCRSGSKAQMPCKFPGGSLGNSDSGREGVPLFEEQSVEGGGITRGVSNHFCDTRESPL